MWTFLIRRLLQSIIVMIGVTLISFVSLQIGGDPTYLFVSENATTEEIEAARIALGFDRPLHIQYLSYIGNVFQGDFGNSLSYRMPAMEVVLEAMPATIELTFFSLVLAIGLSIPLGIYAALHRGKPMDGGIMTVAMLGQSIPNFWMGIMMFLYFGLYLGVVPDIGQRPLSGAAIRGRFPESLHEPSQHAASHGFAILRGRHLHSGSQRAAGAVVPCWRSCSKTMCAPHVLKAFPSGV